MPPRKRRQNFQTIAWFWDLHTRELLDLNPSYQRRSVWNQAYKDDFIDTILLQFSAPAIFLYEEIAPTGKSKYHVVDGKQRLTAIFEFVSGEFPVSDTAQVVSLRGKYFSDLSDDEKTTFWTYEFSVEYLPTNEESLINSIFQRINKNTAKLTRQELRHARFSGQFITTAESLADWMPLQLPEGFPRFDTQSRKQMKDVELVANLLLLLEDGPSGYSQDELDEAFSARDLEWERKEAMDSLFRNVTQQITELLKIDLDPPFYRTRLRNQADFYSLFGAIAELVRYQKLPSTGDMAQRLAEFLAFVEDEHSRELDRRAQDYYQATRSNSNDTGPRKARIAIVSEVLAIG